MMVFDKLPTDFSNDFLGPFYLDNCVFVSYTYYRSFIWRDVRVWLKEHDWKSCIRETVSRVRIPLSPYASPCIYCKGFFCFGIIGISLSERIKSWLSLTPDILAFLSAGAVKRKWRRKSMNFSTNWPGKSCHGAVSL